MRLRSIITAIIATVLAAGLATPAQAEQGRALSCDNAAWQPFWTPGGPDARGLINGEVRRLGMGCGNASVVAVVYRESGWWDEVAASNEQFFAVGTLRATNTCYGGNQEYYTQIRVNGRTIAESDPVNIRC